MNSDHWFRNSILAVILAVVTAALIVAGISLSNSAHQEMSLKGQEIQLVNQEAQLTQEQAALKANVTAQVTNRAKNVNTWCGAINAERTILVSYIAAFNKNRSVIPSLLLPQLDCQGIIDRTLASAAHK